MHRRRANLGFALGVSVALAAGCGGSDGSNEQTDPATGGVAAATGGSGGSSTPALGGQTSTGGQLTGGVGTGGAATGGLPTGGMGTGGAATSGSFTGGIDTGGVSTGGLSTGAAPATGGAESSGGADGGSAGSSGGQGDAGGSGGVGATAGSGGAAEDPGPCDIYQIADTPCVAAHSTVRALYGSYDANLYQVRRASDQATQDIGVLSPGGYADSATQDSFCSGTDCTISIIYDQSPNGNHLTKSPPGGWLNNGGLEADATAAPVTVGGHPVYGVYTTMNWDDDIGAVGYRNNETTGVPTGDDPEDMYMVVSGRHYNEWCCFDYGNAETNNLDNGDATMEAVYFGSSTQWAVGNGSGPWVLADLENGVFHGGDPNAVTDTNTPIDADYVTAMLKGPSGDRFVLKGGDAQSGSLVTKYDGPRPAGYSPMKKEGAIILGTGGDNSHTGEGTFFEGCMTRGVASDEVDDEIQANILAAGYGS